LSFKPACLGLAFCLLQAVIISIFLLIDTMMGICDATEVKSS